ncbi:hypothetical protein Hanom_Chr12g01077011 [Helianthus anomalus]
MTPAPKSTTSTRKRKYKPRREDELNNLVQNFGRSSDWGVQFPTPNSTALDVLLLGTCPYTLISSGKGTFASRCPVQSFYFVTYTGGFYSFSSRTTEVNPCSRDPPKSLHDWKQTFFYICCGIIPLDMHYRAESEGVPRVNVSIGFADQEWYKVLSRKVTPIIQLEERALVAASMSMLWAPRDPRGFSIYGYQGKGIIVIDSFFGFPPLFCYMPLHALFVCLSAGYNLMNVFDSKAGGAMVIVVLPEGRPLLVDHIKDNFLHPTSESMAAYANAMLGEDGMDDTDVDYVPAREEVIVLSREGSDESHEGLIRRSTRAGLPQGTVNEPVDDVETPVDTAEQLETRKKKRGDKPEKKKVEEPVSEAPRKTPSNLSFLDYVVVSDTLSSLDARVNRSERDPDDDATLTEIAKKEKLLEDKKKELDAQAVAALAEEKSKLQKETTTAPSESEIDLGVFSVKPGNLLEKMYNSGSDS